MSTASSPQRISGDFGGGYYDPSYTEDISNKMRVPRSIRLAHESPDGNVVANDRAAGDAFNRGNGNYEALRMTVPERIIVAGQDQHMGVRAPPRELRLEQRMTPHLEHIHVQTPPRVITLDEHPFPCVEQELKESQMHRKQNHKLEDEAGSGSLDEDRNCMEMSHYSNMPTDQPTSPTEDFMVMRRQMSKLGRRVLILEQEQRGRQQKEAVATVAVITYFFFKVMRWLYKNW